MKLYIYSIILIICFNVKASERIINFNSFITVNKDHTISVLEEIEVNVEHSKIKRGIFREIPLKRKLPNGEIQTSALKVLSVMRNGNKEKFHIKSISRGGVHIRIGNKDHYVEKGLQKYTILYKIDRQLRNLDEINTELFWNVTGSFWDFPIENSEVKIQTSDGSPLKFINAFTGKTGEKGLDFKVHSNENEVFAQTTKSLSPREGWSIGVSFPTHYLNQLTPFQEIIQHLKIKGSLKGFFWSFLSLIVSFLVWYFHGMDPKRTSIIPRFKSPKNLTPAAINYIYLGYYDNDAFSAALINMAVKSFIIIDMESSNVQILPGENKEISNLAPEEKIIYDNFISNESGMFLNRTNRDKIINTIILFSKSLKERYSIYHSLNLIYSVFVLLFCIFAHYMAIKPLEGTNIITFIGVLEYISVGFILGVALFKKMTSKRFRSVFFAILVSGFLLFHGGIFGISARGTSFDIWLQLFLIAVPTGFFIGFMPSATRNGQRLIDEIDGLKLYLSMAEKDRLDKLNPPEMNIQTFEIFLPYAHALGETNRWTDGFESILTNALVDNRRAHLFHWHRHNFSNQSISDLTSSIGSAISSSVASSSSSSSPGGSSGGGGGGGGGGGW